MAWQKQINSNNSHKGACLKREGGRTVAGLRVRAKLRSAPASLASPSLPRQPRHALVGPKSCDMKSREGEQHGRRVVDVLEHVAVAAPPPRSRSHVPTPTPFHPLAPSGEKLTSVKGDLRGWASAAPPFISEGPERDIPTMARAPSALLRVPHSSPSTTPAQPRQRYVR